MVSRSEAFRGHESVTYFHDHDSGLKAIVALHSTALGPAAGGCRMWPYASEEAALEDVLRLSRGMSFKNAMAGLPFGGGKSVIIGDSRHDKSERLLRAFGRCIESFGGRYVAAEDVGIGESDIEVLAQETRYVAGRRQHGASAGGNPAPKTAFGVFLGMRAAVELRLGRSDFEGLKVAVQGVGQVGYHLCKLLHSAGAALVVADVNAANAERAAGEFGARVVVPEAVLFEAVDVVSPCALGAVFSRDNVARIQAGLIIGAANNQLATDDVGAELMRRGVLYAPDYVVNAGGVVSVALEYQGGFSEKDVWTRVNGIYETTRLVLIQAMREERAANEVADEIALARIAAARRRDTEGLRRAS
jgi:leucine dehydrogenase